MAVRMLAKSRRDLLAENEQLRLSLEEAQETLRAIRSGEVDALVVAGTDGERVFTLHGADRSYRALIEEMNEGALTLTSEGMILYANETFAGMLGASFSSLIGASLQERVTPGSRAVLEALLRQGAREKCHAEMVLAAADGATVPVYVSLTPMTLEGVHDYIGAVVMGLTERKRAEQALQVSETKFRNIFQNASLGKALIGVDGSVEVNNAAVAILGYSAEELRSLVWTDAAHPDDVQAAQNAFNGLREGHFAGARFEMRLVHKSGSVVWADVTLSLVKDQAGNPLYVLISAYDISARKEADAAFQDLRQHLQHYVEAERLHLAQDLHDVPLQELYGILYRLEELRPKLLPKNAEVISEVIGDIKSTLSSLRAIASDLRPPTISRFGFEKAARSYIAEFREKHPAMVVNASLKRDVQILPEDTRLMFFRILQESFSNLVKHAHATEVSVRFQFDDREACLEITDNGQGFTVPPNWVSLVQGDHYGIAGMAERVSIVGGSLKITSTPGVSTTVRAVMPYSPAQPAAAPRSRSRRKTSR